MNVDCCASEIVPGATFYRRYDAATDRFNDTSWPATVSEFRLDTYEVTVRRFRNFVNAGFGTQENPPTAGSGVHPNLAGSGWVESWNANLPANTSALIDAIDCGNWTSNPGINDNEPMTCISWYEAFAFCIWDGGYLPTEAETNLAATGGTEYRAYPWSSPATSTTIDCTYANFYNGTNGYCVGTGEPNRVGSGSPKGDGRWGHADLAGNVSEWVLDWSTTSPPTPCNDCASLTAATYRVLKGGGYASGNVTLRSANTNGLQPTSHTAQNGVRCARLP